MIRTALKLARLPVFATVAAAVALLVLPGRAEIVLDIYVLVIGGFALGVLVAAVRRANPVAASSPFERALRERERRPERLPDLERIERELTLACQTAADVHFRLRPRLRRVAARLLSAKRGLDLDADPPAARRVLGDELWELVRADREPPHRRDAPGLSLPESERIVAALESV